MAKSKNVKKTNVRQNSSRPPSRSSSNRYSEYPRGYREAPREYAERPNRYYDGSSYYERDARRSYDDRYRSTQGRPASQRRTDPRGSDSRRGRQDPRRSQDPRRRRPGDPGRKGRKRRRPVRLKKRFYVFALILILLVALGGYFGIKALTGHVIPSLSHKIHSVVSGDIEEDDQGNAGKEVDEQFSDFDSVTMEPMILDDLGTENAETKVVNTEEMEGEEGDGSGETPVLDENTVDLATLPMEEKIRAAILSSWYISPLGQNRATIEESFGVLNKYEDWAGGVYYHKGFPDSMYVTYRGKNGSDGMPNENATCSSVSVALKQIIQFETFEPNEKFGAMHKDGGDYGWTDYYYSILIQKGINLIIYCNDDGSVNQETHIIVRQV